MILWTKWLKHNSLLIFFSSFSLYSNGIIPWIHRISVHPDPHYSTRRASTATSLPPNGSKLTTLTARKLRWVGLPYWLISQLILADSRSQATRAYSRQIRVWWETFWRLEHGFKERSSNLNLNQSIKKTFNPTRFLFSSPLSLVHSMSNNLSPCVLDIVKIEK